MHKYVLAFVLGTGLSVGCGGGGGGGLSAKSYKEETCACKTEECLDGVDKKYEDWKFDQMQKAMKSGKPSEPSQAELDLDAARMHCMMDIKLGK